jgi:hypothetical protein
VGRRSEFFLQPLESRRFLSGATAPERAVAEETVPVESAQVSPPHVVEQQVAQLRSALSEMADRMARFEKLMDGS